MTSPLPASTDPADTLAAVVALRREADRQEREAIDEALDRGWTWTAIAEALGVTRQAAHKRHAKRVAARHGGSGRDDEKKWSRPDVGTTPEPLR